GMAPALFPILGKPLEHELHQAADEIGVMTARQHQKTGVVRQQATTAVTLFGSPANESISIFDVEGRRAPRGYGQPLVLVNEGIAQMLAHKGRVFEIMMFDDGLIAAGDVLR